MLVVLTHESFHLEVVSFGKTPRWSEVLAKCLINGGAHATKQLLVLTSSETVHFI